MQNISTESKINNRKNFARPRINEIAENLKLNINPEIIDIFNNLKKTNEYLNKIFDNFNNVLSKLSPVVIPKISLGITTFLTNTRIINGHWVVINDELFDLLKTKKSVDEISKTIIDFYTKDKYKNLELLFEEIDYLDIIPERVPILKSCIKILKKNSQKNAYNVILPTLMAQITGIIEEDCYNLIPKNILIKNENNKSVSKVRELANALEHYKCDLLFYEMFESAIFNGLFKHVNKSDYENYKNEYGSNRHKILHGEKEFLDYGTKENLIRTSLDLYMLCYAKIILQNSIQNNEVLENAE